MSEKIHITIEHEGEISEHDLEDLGERVELALPIVLLQTLRNPKVTEIWTEGDEPTDAEMARQNPFAL